MDQYVELSTIGSGASSIVKLAKRKQDGCYVVLKVYHLPISQYSYEEKERLEKENAILSSLSHPNIIKYIESFVHEGHRVLVMEYANALSLRNYIDYLKDTDRVIAITLLLSWINAILEGLQYIHDLHIIHRDLKPENILLSSSDPKPLSKEQLRRVYSPTQVMKLKVKIADFGIARETTGEFAVTQVGTPFYIAPEICGNRVYTNKVDMWSLGCILFELIAKHPPFHGSSIGGLFHSIIYTPTPPLPSSCPSPFVRIVQSLLRKDPAQRPSARELKVTLQALFQTASPSPFIRVSGRRYSVAALSPRSPTLSLSDDESVSSARNSVSGTGSLRCRKYTPSPSPHPLGDSSDSDQSGELYSLL